METAYDILPFWVMRMIMLGIYATGKVPFEKVLIHGLVRDKSGQKISKSKGNVINPLLMTEKYGTDALRVSLIWGALIENDISLSEENIKGQKNFANKIWNAARFVLNLEKPSGERTDEFTLKINEISNEVSKNVEAFKLNAAIEILYDKFWHWYCDNCIERAKKEELSKADLVHGLIIFLKLLHPFMPFVTEAIWGEIKNLRKHPNELLISSTWPEVKKK
jgi:valyl-tRNA synthetase